MSEAFAFISVPAALANLNGQVNKIKLARIERALNAEFPNRHFGLSVSPQGNGLLIRASSRYFFGDGADEALRAVFRKTVAACGY